MKAKFFVHDAQKIKRSLERPNLHSPSIQQSIVDVAQLHSKELGIKNVISTPSEVLKILNGREKDFSLRYFNTFITYFFSRPENLDKSQFHTIEQFVEFLNSYESKGAEASIDNQTAYTTNIESALESYGITHPFHEYKFRLNADWKFTITRKVDNHQLYPPTEENAPQKRKSPLLYLWIFILGIVIAGITLYVKEKSSQRRSFEDKILKAKKLENNGLNEQAMAEYEAILKSINQTKYRSLYATTQHLRYRYYDFTYDEDELIRASIELKEAIKYFSRSNENKKVDLSRVDLLSVYAQLYEVNRNPDLLDSMKVLFQENKSSNQIVQWQDDFIRSRWFMFHFNLSKNYADLDSALYYLNKSSSLCKDLDEEIEFCFMYYIERGSIYGEKYHITKLEAYLDSMDLCFQFAKSAISSAQRLGIEHALVRFGLGHVLYHRYQQTDDELMLNQAEELLSTTLLTYDSIQYPSYYASSNIMLAKINWLKYKRDNSLKPLNKTIAHIKNASLTVKENHFSGLYFMGILFCAEALYEKALSTSDIKLFQEAMIYAREVKLSGYYSFLSEEANRATQTELLSLYHSLPPSDSIYFLQSFWKNVIHPIDTLIEQGITNREILTLQAKRVQSICEPLVRASKNNRIILSAYIIYGLMLESEDQRDEAVNFSKKFKKSLDANHYQDFPFLKPIPGLDEY